MEVIRSVVFSLATVAAAVMFKTIEVAILQQTSIGPIFAIQYELLIITVTASLSGFAVAPQGKRHLFYKPLVGLLVVLVAIFFFLAVATLWSSQPYGLYIVLTIVLPDVLGFAALGWTVWTIGRAKS